MLKKVIINNKESLLYIKDNKSKNTLVFLHGMNSSSDTGVDFYKNKSNFNIIALNMPGSNHNPEDEINMDMWLDYAIEVIDRIRNTNLYLLSHSMSGGIAAELMNHFNFQKVFFMDTIHPFMSKQKTYGLLKILVKPESIIDKTAQKLLKLGMAKRIKNDPWIAGFVDPDSIWSTLLANNVLDKEYLENINKNIQKHLDKTYFIIGKDDQVISTNEFIEYAHSINRPITIIGSGHSPQKTAPNYITNYLNKEINYKRRYWIFPNKIFR